ncbi:TauD/TfdA family dioxygenase [Enterovibrio sp. ZSDZ35]|uniref:TauD/TfdA family dioxygenase n=2 Tax=Enterovibrio qingdaonensis TaxID=2899818 RepID=A0ABT5QPA4_9GAMM|nr:TauD/TfdA family dioxygenase [Enterovibrio sp. ZSDZ35]MDD1782814.1 TauD/TfdA family dioxygenase [Enterovibrio sp. ZSDZ35]
MIEDVDLSSLTKDEFERIYDAFLKHKVIFFRKQNLSPESQLALASRFGTLEKPHPFFPHVSGFPQVSVIETERGNPPGKSYWHTDMTWQAVPPKCSVLVAQHLPDHGGDTIWLSMEAVYQALPMTVKQCLENKRAVHAVQGFVGSRFDKHDGMGLSQVEKLSKDIDAVLHPLVVQHLETGNPTLFINEQFTQCIDGEEPKESDALLASLFSFCREEAFQVRFKWEVGSVAIWDNRCTQHFAVTDYGDAPRRLHRVVVEGTQPKAFETSNT